MAYIYKITNLITNEIYIGQTASSPEARWKQHIRESYDALHGKRRSFPMFHRSIIVYGQDSFKCEVVEECPESKLNERELFWINYFNTFEQGYNIGIPKKTNKDEVYTSKKINQKVIQYSLDGKFLKIFENAKDAAERNNVHPSNIRRACAQEYSQSGGFQWRWYKENFDKQIDPIPSSKQIPKRKVQQFSKTGHLLAEFDSISEAAKSIDTKYINIYNCCNNKTKTSQGFIWKYKN